LIYRIEILRSARKQMMTLPEKSQTVIINHIDSLRERSRPPNGRKLRGADLWRLRVGHYRIIYHIDDKAGLIRIVKVAARRADTYRQL
jgi:mRNA interferase RelE/StbE